MVFPKRNRNRNKNNDSQSGSVGVLDGGGVAARQPRHQYKTRVRLLRQLNVMSQRLAATITGDADTIESPRGDYTSFFMETERGPTMVVSHAGTPDRATGDELVGDLQQIYGYGANGQAPSALLMHVDAGEEAGAREAAQAIIDRLNAERGDADQLVLREDGIENTSGGTRSLSFRVERAGPVVPVGGDQPVGVGQPVGDGQPVGVGQPPADGLQPDGLPPDDGPLPNDGPPPVGANVVGPLPADPPDDPDADLRSDVELKALPTVDAFKAATRERSLRGRTAEYERLVSRLDAYQRELADYTAEAQVVKGEMTALGAEKARQLELGIAAGRRIPRLEQNASAYEGARDLALRRLHGDEALDDATRASLEQTVRTETARVTQARDEIARLRQQGADATAEVQRLDGRLRTATALNKQVIRRYNARLGERGADLANAAKAYLDSKKHSATDPKQIAVRDLLQRATDPGQNLQRLKDAASDVWGAEFRNQLAGPTRLLNTGTASDVFRVETNGEIGLSGKRVGFAKRALQADDYNNDTTDNLDIPKDLSRFRDEDAKSPLTEAPNLIARQVVSSRIARELGLDVVADEVFSRDSDGHPIGVTAEAPGRQLRREEHLPDGSTRLVFAGFDLRDPRIQRNLANLHVMDALTGQLDRHLGNVFIDAESGRVTGIDNDMAFGRLPIDDNVGNQLPTFEIQGDQVTFRADQIDRELAARIMDPTFERALIGLLRGRPTDPERLAPDLRADFDTLTGQARADELARFPEVLLTLDRLTAIKNRITELERAGQLIGGPDRPWGVATYNHALTRVEGDGAFAKELNYLVRAQRGFDGAGNPADPTMVQEAQGGG